MSLLRLPNPDPPGSVRHHRALHFSDVASALDKVDGHPRVGRVVQLAIRFGVLTAARQAEVRRSAWGEFDLDGAVWTVPAAHMKRGRAQRVPLSTGALAVLDEARGLSGGRGVAIGDSIDIGTATCFGPVPNRCLATPRA